MARANKIDDSVYERLHDILAGPEAERKFALYRPPLTPTQERIYDSQAKYILADGERGSGKTWILGGHKLVHHCVTNFNALALIIVGVRSQATQGGVWHKLQHMILPMWAENMGIKYTDVRRDTQQNEFIDIENTQGGWSRVVLMSAPFGTQLRLRIRGFEPSYVFIDELTTLDGPVYFDAVVQQVGRRPGIQGVQQYTAATNPDGPSHWVYRRFFEIPINPLTGARNPAYARFHCPIHENIGNLPEGYYDRIREAVMDDPVEAARMLHGEWIDRPSGEAIFKDYFFETTHSRGDKTERILPNADFPIIIGYDLGSANNAIIFMQFLTLREKTMWVVFDEMVYTQRRIRYDVLVPAIMKRINTWNRICETRFVTTHISDNSAFNTYRPASEGSYDVLEVERISKLHVERFPDVGSIRMVPAPKFSGSVEARVRILMNCLQREEFLLSHACFKTKEMFMRLESAEYEVRAGRKDYNPSLPFTPKRSKHLHPFDALTYPMLTLDIRRIATVRTGEPTQSFVEVGRG
jgi:hypothetical protein